MEEYLEALPEVKRAGFPSSRPSATRRRGTNPGQLLEKEVALNTSSFPPTIRGNPLILSWTWQKPSGGCIRSRLDENFSNTRYRGGWQKSCGTSWTVCGHQFLRAGPGFPTLTRQSIHWARPTGQGWLSGLPSVHCPPHCYQIASVQPKPVIAVGGICTGRDAFSSSWRASWCRICFSGIRTGRKFTERCREMESGWIPLELPH